MWIVFILMQCSPLSAQFYTVGKKVVLYKVQERQDLPESGKVCRVDSSTNVGKSMEDSKEEWVRKYLSVSFPLKRMVVNSPYGWRSDPFTGKRKLHAGIDFQARSYEVYAMMEGEVVKVGYDKRSGIYVTIRHGDYTVSYCHLSKTLVGKGYKVMPGETVACTGNTGRSTGEHLHLGVKHRGKIVNPKVILDFIKEMQAECLSNLI